MAKNLADEKEADFETAHFREKGFVIRPEIGWSFAEKERWSAAHAVRGLSAQFSIGYQAGPHLFLGVVGGYGGVCKDGSEKMARINPTIGGDIRWYLIDHEYSFLIDVRGGWGKRKIYSFHYYYDDNLYDLYFLQISGGFALGNGVDFILPLLLCFALLAEVVVEPEGEGLSCFLWASMPCMPSHTVAMKPQRARMMVTLYIQVSQVNTCSL